ncbi:MAG: FkbM family methyltransferase [Rickettsiales bacterium]|nr:FkbM family methyltransferase [Rickettsiales bacterium]
MGKTLQFHNLIKNNLDILIRLSNAAPLYICKKIHLNSRGDIWVLPNGIKLYVPLYPWDYIQEIIVDSDNFFEIDILRKCAAYIPENAVVLDVGANIGNHSIYWAAMCGARKIHAFEPLPASYDYLLKNIEINGLGDVITPHKFALGNKRGQGRIQKNYGNNIGMASIMENARQSGSEVRIERFDDLDISAEKVDFVKIDVEGFELKTLAGMRMMIARFHPAVLIETFAESYAAVSDFFAKLGYGQKDKFADGNYLFVAD